MRFEHSKAQGKQNTSRRTSHIEQSWTLCNPHSIIHWRISSFMPRISSLLFLAACASNNPNSRSTVGCVRMRPHIPANPKRELNRITPVKIVKVLGEGGFSFVYLAQDEASRVSASSCDRVLPVVTTDANRVGSERVCPEKDSVPNWHRGCRVSHARSRGIPEIQVRPRPFSFIATT